MKPLIAIVGPTGIGKTKLAIHLAMRLNGEIVSADSRQVYRHMDIGTDKPGPEELSLVPHHLIDIINPDETFGLARFQQLAGGAISSIQQRNHLPLLVGGSGQYVRAVLEGWDIPHVPPNPELRRSLEEKAASRGSNGLYQELKSVDPTAAARIDPSNVRRVIRALEIYQSATTPTPRPGQKKSPPFTPLIIGLTTARKELYRRIDRRVDSMIERGLVSEVEKLLKMGYDFSLPAMSGIGYKQIGMFLNDELTLAEAVQQIKYETHRFVRHQYMWFQLKDARIRWLDIRDNPEEAINRLVTEFIASGGT